MLRCSAVFCSTALIALLAGCSDTTVTTANTDADVKAIKDIEVQWNKDFAAKDGAKLASHYADDAVLMNPGAPPAKGKADIQKAVTEMVADPAFALTFSNESVDVAKAGDMAYTKGVYTMTVTDPVTKKPVNDKGTYLTVYKKQADGSWKSVQDTAVSSVPPPAPPPAKKKK
jgi:uncharacterized protein (TIGR02246 family)